MAPLETKIIFQAPIFHFHDYGRKGNCTRQKGTVVFFNSKVEELDFFKKRWEIRANVLFFSEKWALTCGGCWSRYSRNRFFPLARWANEKTSTWGLFWFFSGGIRHPKLTLVKGIMMKFWHSNGNFAGYPPKLPYFRGLRSFLKPSVFSIYSSNVLVCVYSSCSNHFCSRGFGVG